jgi:hypothetical protein
MRILPFLWKVLSRVLLSHPFAHAFWDVSFWESALLWFATRFGASERQWIALPCSATDREGEPALFLYAHNVQSNHWKLELLTPNKANKVKR